MSNQQQEDRVEILRGIGVEIVLKHEPNGIQYGCRMAGGTPQYGIWWATDREALMAMLLAGTNLIERDGRIIEVY